jgi:transposase InsO family protein
MMPVLSASLAFVASLFRSRLSLQLEVMALRHQLGVYQRGGKRPKLTPADRVFWSWLAQCWVDWRRALVLVKPETVVAWQRKRFRDHWARLSRRRRPGRPRVALEVQNLIRQMSLANRLWGSERIVGELQKIGINVAKSTVEKYMVRPRRPGATSQTWKTFLRNHMKEIVSVDFFVVPTIRNQVLFVFLVLVLDRRKVVHFNVTANPTAEWTGQQIREAFPWEAPPKYLLRERDRIYEGAFRKRVSAIGFEEIRIAPSSPWQNPFVERLIGTIRRECLDHVVVIDDRHLKRLLRGYLGYYHGWRTHQSLEMDTPDGRSVQDRTSGNVIEIPELSGLHHHYERVAV